LNIEPKKYRFIWSLEDMKHTRSFLLSLLLIAGLLLAACGPANNATPTAPVPGTGDEDPAQPADSEILEELEPEPVVIEGPGTTLPDDCGTVQLTYWNPFTGPDGPFMGELVNQFNAEHDNIEVTMNSQGDYYTQLTTAAASETLPDVAIIHADQVATQAFRNVLRPIDNMVNQLAMSGDDFPDAVWAAGEVAGSRYAIPLDIHPMTMFYNADLFQQYNVQGEPMTREEFEQAAASMTDTENFGYMITTGFPVAQIFQMLLHQFGGSEFNEDGTEATWNSEAGVQALTWMRDAQQNYSDQNLEVDAELNAFRAGYVGMIWNGIWQITNVTGDGVAFTGVATSVPQIGPQMAVWAGSHQLTLPTQTGPADSCRDTAAGIFIQYLLDNSITWSRAGQIPASNNVRQSSEFQALEPQNAIGTSVEDAFFPPAVPGITDAFGPMGEAVSAVMAGEATDIQAALDSSAQRANEILDENRRTYGDTPGGGN
jgi:multiple sugar transport system substrate-binding protein